MARANTGFAIAAIGATFCVSIADAGVFSFFKRNHTENCECSEDAGPACDGRAQPSSSPPAGTSGTDSDPQGNPSAAAAGAPQAPVQFVAPTPTGEVTGSRSSFELPSIRMTLPKLALESPSLRLNGGARVRRDPQMDIDGAVAGVSSGPPIIHGPLIGGRTTSTPQTPPAATNGAPTSPPAAPSGAPAGASGNNCVDPCALREQQDEVRQLTQQVQQLQGIILQLAEQQQAAAESGETFEEEQPAAEVGYVPRKAKLTSSTRSVKNSPTRESLAASDRLQRLQEILEEKQAEMDALQAEQEEVEAAEREEIEAAERRLATRKNQLEAERVARLRNRMARESSTQEPVARRASMIERTNYEDEAFVEEEDPVPVVPKQLMSKPPRMKSVQATPIRRSASQIFEDEER